VLNKSLFPFLLLFIPATALGQSGPTYRFFTNLGNIDVVLTPGNAPMTVANFINYVNTGAYTNSIIHRSVPGFVIQGGGYQYQNGNVVTTPTNPPVVNEFNVSNTTGTIAMAKLSGDPNSATSQWFFNLADNGTNSDALDTTDGGYTVFGNVTSATLKVMNSIANLPIFDCSGDGGICPLSTTNSAFNTLPLTNSNYVLVTSILPVPTLSQAGVESAASFASNLSTGVSPGELLVIYGSALGPSQLTTLTVNNGVVSNSLGGTQVTFDGKPAPIIYTSSGQISVVAPYSISSLPSIDIQLTYNGTLSNQITLPVKPANPAIFTLNASGTGDAAIVRLDGSIVSSSSPASVGDTLLLFGEGYGLPTSATMLADGAIVGSTLPVPAACATNCSLLIDGQTVPTLYFGGAPSLVNGVLQVNFTVPKLAPGTHQIQLSVGTPARVSPTGVTITTK
jgi:uncharacterized protein (TIGR03437 family)